MVKNKRWHIIRNMMARSVLFSVLLTFLHLLPLILCDVNSLGSGGYHYPHPQPPLIQFDEPSTPSSIYLPQPHPVPPIFQEEEYFPPAEFSPIPVGTYLPPSYYPPIGTPPEIFSDVDTIAITPPSTPATLYQNPIPKMKILNMSCILNSSFKSTIQVDGRTSFQPPPVIDDASAGCLNSKSISTFEIDMEGSQKMAQCGVRRCSVGPNSKINMCVTVRMPTIQGLKLPEDGLVTLQCTPQDSVVSHTKHLRLGPTSVSKGRSASRGIVATGGGPKSFNSNLMLLRKSPGSKSFDQPLQTGSVVLLGEEIVLRASVQDGDGWKYSRMGPVLIRSSNSQKSLTLVEENGCRSAGIRNICPYQPKQLTPLDNILHFRAFLFQDSARGDDMVLSVRMLGCLNPQDCFQNGACDGANLTPPQRSKRQAKLSNESTWESQIEFRVQMPPSEQLVPTRNIDNDIIIIPKPFVIVVILLVMCIIILIVLFTVYCRKKLSY